MRNTLKGLLACVLLAVLAGCADVGNVRLLQDNPADIEPLLNQHEYARIRQLTGRYPEIDSPELQGLVSAREQAYAEDVIAEARALEAGNDLLGAVQVLSLALQRVPHNSELRELRNALEKERQKELKRNERERLITRANYILDQQMLYRQQVNLAPPSIIERWEHMRTEKEVVQLSGQLLEHGEYALLQGDLLSAETCLRLSLQLQHSSAAEEMLSHMHSLQSSRQEVAQKKESIKQAIKEQKIQHTQKQQTEALLVIIQQALQQGKLQEAVEAFRQIPPASRDKSEVKAVWVKLQEAVNRDVSRLVASGDSLYRADKVNEALSHWNEAYALAPKNQQLQERIDRANRVMARLEELKRQQP